jgi:hypothetical protein
MGAVQRDRLSRPMMNEEHRQQKELDGKCMFELSGRHFEKIDRERIPRPEKYRCRTHKYSGSEDDDASRSIARQAPFLPAIPA